MSGSITEAQHWHREGVAEGKSAATAAIVAWARSQGKTALWQEIANAIERGDHLKEHAE
jgi:hypothetical protein